MGQGESGDKDSSVFAAAKVAGSAPPEEKRGPGRPAGSGKASAPKKPSKADQDAAFRDAVFSPDTLSGLVVLPFDIAQAATGWDGWELSETETKILATTGAEAAKHFVSVDPKWIALTVFGLTFLKLLGVRAMAYKTFVKAEAETKRAPHVETKAA